MKNLAAYESEKAAKRNAAVAQMISELNAAGIKATVFDRDAPNSEVPGNVIGTLSFWVFERRWYYWSAHGPGLPVDVAERLHATHGKVVRVAGHCGCPSPREWYKGFGVPDYHVDTSEGLNALADAIRSVYDASQYPNSQPYCGGDIKEGLVSDYRKKSAALPKEGECSRNDG